MTGDQRDIVPKTICKRPTLICMTPPIAWSRPAIVETTPVKKATSAFPSTLQHRDQQPDDDPKSRPDDVVEQPGEKLSGVLDDWTKLLKAANSWKPCPKD